jgi:peptidoglycan/xylan/chitin deacetylase (PgdA/CDA1 family)
MLTFKNTFAVFFLVIGMINWLHFGFGLPIYGWYFIVLTILTLGVAAYGSSYIGSNYHFRVICRGNNPAKNQIALTFDDGIDPVKTPQILDILAKHNIKASFFCIGNTCANNEPIMKKMYEAGHNIGNHTFSHSHWFDFYGARKMLKELEQTDQIIKKITGRKPFYFRPPYGVTNPAMKKALLKSGHLPVGWSIRSFDTNSKTPAVEIINRVTSRLTAGDIILFHDTANKIFEVLESVIQFGTKNGYSFVTIEELIGINAYTD